MGKKSKKIKVSGEELFNEFYADIFKERWPALKESLLEPKKFVLLAPEHLGYPTENLKSFFDLPFLFEMEEEIRDQNDKCYFLDGASALAPMLLEVKPGEKVLDLCAAPGGKAILLGLQLQGEGELVANDKSPNRRGRLKNVLETYLPQDFYQNHVRVTGHDASSWCLHETEAYDKILLDAPCSSEKHVLESAKHLAEWKIGRTKKLAALQWTMLASAWLVLKKGGRLVYSTCSISPLENDQVVEKLMKKFGDEVKKIENPFDLGSNTEFGTWVTPDDHGHGPFYFSILEKR